MGPFTDTEIERLLAFIGYGRLDAPVWFLGMEEGGGGEDNLRRRLTFCNVEDNYDAHRKLDITKFHEGRRAIQRTWPGMCHVMLRLKGLEPTTENVRCYQAEQLGRRHGNSLIVELMPLPKPNLAHWEYGNIIPRFASAGAYYETVKPRRIELLRTLIQQHAPRAIIAFGKRYWPEYASLLNQLLGDTSDSFPLMVADGTTMILTPHFISRTMNGRGCYDLLVRELLAACPELDHMSEVCRQEVTVVER